MGILCQLLDLGELKRTPVGRETIVQTLGVCGIDVVLLRQILLLEGY